MFDGVDVANRFRQEDIVPQIINKPPDEILKVRFRSGQEAYFGNEINPTDAVNPRYEWPADKKKLYTVAMFDPDVTIADTEETTQFLHHLVVNVRGRRVSQGDVLDNYVVPVPPEQIFSHRYVELVYEQKDRIDETMPVERFHFDMQQFANDHSFGRPVAGNFFISTMD